MMLRLLMILLLASVSPTPCTDAGEIIGFKAGPQTGTDVVLSHVARKALVAEFLDPDDTGMGKSISYLVWREILTAISDQAGAGVILARAPGNERITDMLEQAYHEAAIGLAKGQEAGMAVWGAVNAAGDNLYVSTYLSLLPETADVQLKLGLFGQPPLAPGLQAEITRTNYNFPPVETTRAQLFDRRIVTRAAVTLRATADPSAKAIAKVSKNTALDAVDMDKGWFKVRLANGTFAYLDNSVVDVPPGTIEAAHVPITLKAAPAGQAVRKVTLNGTYRVLDMRYVAKTGLWYELAVGDARGWVPAHLVRARFSLPIVHFVAGLYRYQFKRYEDARREFAQYVSAPNSAADNPSLAAAYQLLGAGTLLTKGTVFEADPSTMDYFSSAVKATPYDPAAYSLRALSALAVQKEAGRALKDLEQALTLDPTDPIPPKIIDALRTELKKPHSTMKYLLRDGQNPAVLQQLDDMATRYPIADVPTPQ